jgi:isopentenyldiphosphate isomerase
MAEWLDVVDARDRVTGRATRAAIHARGLRHRATHVLLFRAGGELFLQRRSFNKDNDPGLWDSSVSGHVDAGENYLACARRESREELGVAPGRLRLALRLPASPATGMEFTRVYTGAHAGPFHLQPDEIIDGCWLTPAAIDAWVARAPHEFSSCFRLLWSTMRLQAHGGMTND